MNSFYQLAQSEALVLGLLAGIVGPIVLLRKRAFFTVALTHASFPGGIIAALMGMNVVLGAGVFSLVLVAVLAALSRVRRQGDQVATGVVLTGGFALGMLLQSLNPARAGAVSSYLVGSILTVRESDVAASAVVLAAAVIVVGVWGKELVFSSFDRVGYAAVGYSPVFIDVIALVLIAATVAVMMPAAGAILAIALIVGPAAAARALTGRLFLLMPLAATFGVISTLGGLEISKAWNVAAGGSMSLLAAALFVCALLVRAGVTRLRAAR
ncbi:metal ABC transporter permease [Rarobacter incanus]|uniref:ABC-type Mn2+/Zn2+ transport system permease subunit n=1 Tax=Rarobacter incanus TaxID=153494 RepID=A0A542SQK2_9MICO|nr:metal ABC transporter permease [Rarobacter incanus]TQK76882.1 ABC-type Mn2+/Zn2+ transport system permease subunit [Rarobacter incanus]